MAAASFPEIACNGALQCMHLISRRYLSVRWSDRNAVAGCGAHHRYLTEHPIEHIAFCETRLGVQGWRTLRDVAMHSEADLPGALAWLRGIETEGAA
jgi:hypothetical protein